MTTLVLTVIGDDRAGLVSALAGCVTEHGGNWLESQMARLAGKFAGIALVDVPMAALDGFLAAADALSAEGLRVTVTPTEQADAGGDLVALHVIGNDQPGIVRQVSQALAERGVSIDELQTATVAAPMSGDTLFEAHAKVRIPEGVSLDEVRAALEAIAGELMVDLDLEPTA